MEFSIQPNIVKIPAGSQAVMLNISAKLKNSYVLEQEDQSLTRSTSLNTPNENYPKSSHGAV